MPTLTLHRLVAWQRAIDLTAAVHHVTASFTRGQRNGLVDQLQRAALSVSCNIGEGYGRGTAADFGHFLSIANGSLLEVETLLAVVRRLGFGNAEAVQGAIEAVDAVAGPLNGLRKRVCPHPAPRTLHPQSSGRARSAPAASGTRPAQ